MVCGRTKPEAEAEVARLPWPPTQTQRFHPLLRHTRQQQPQGSSRLPQGCKQAAVHPEPSGPGRTSPRSSFRVGVRGHGGLVFQLKLKQGWSQTQPQACEHTHIHTHGFTPLAALKPFFLGIYGTEIKRSERSRSFKPHKHAGTVQSNIPLIQTKSSAGPVWLCWKPAGLASAFPWQK